MVDSPIDAVVLSVVFAVGALIVRGVLRGAIRICDPGSCGGGCSCCREGCEQRNLVLTTDQRAELAEIDRRAKEMCAS